MDTPLGQLAVAPAAPADTGAILRLRDGLATWMLERGIEQWRPGEMPAKWIDQCIAHGWVFVARDGDRIVGSVALVSADPFIWGDRAESAGYVHMLMVDRALAGHGFGRALLAWTERRIASVGTRLARLDCVCSNAELRAYYERAGYTLVGTRDFAGIGAASLGGITPPPTALFEKSLRS